MIDCSSFSSSSVNVSGRWTDARDISFPFGSVVVLSWRRGVVCCWSVEVDAVLSCRSKRQEGCTCRHVCGDDIDDAYLQSLCLVSINTKMQSPVTKGEDVL